MSPVNPCAVPLRQSSNKQTTVLQACWTFRCFGIIMISTSLKRWHGADASQAGAASDIHSYTVFSHRLVSPANKIYKDKRGAEHCI